MLGLARLFSFRAPCGALLLTILSACRGDALSDSDDTDSRAGPASAQNGAVDTGGPGGSVDARFGGSAALSGSADLDAGNRCTTDGPGPDAAGNDAAETIHPLAGRYAVRTVLYARQKANVAGSELDIISEGTLLSVADISRAGVVTEHYCFIETANAEGIYSWTQPSATENIPNSVVALVREGDAFVRAEEDDRSYVSWSPASQPVDCVRDELHATGCLCGDPGALPVDARDCRVFDLEGDGALGGALFIHLARATDPSRAEHLVKLSIVGDKAIAWRIDATQPGPNLVGAIAGGIAQSELGRAGDPELLQLFGPIRNSVCPGSYGHVELVPGDFSCDTILAGRGLDIDGYGMFDTTLDSDLSTADVDVCPDPDACKAGVEKDTCGVCGGSGIDVGTCDCAGTTPGTWYADSDGDGYGDPVTGQAACAQPAGYVGDGTDLCPAHMGKVAPGVCGCAAADTDADGDGVADCNDACPDDGTKATLGLCGCGVPEAKCAVITSLVGTYTVRSLVFAKRQNEGSPTITTSKAINLSLVTVTDNGDGSLQLRDKACFTTTVPNPADALRDRVYSWSRASWVQALHPVVRTVVDTGFGRWTRQGVLTQVGWSSGQACEAGCDCATDSAALPAYHNTGAPYDCRLVDEDGDRVPAITAYVQASLSGNWSSVDGTLNSGVANARVLAVSSAYNTWSIAPASDGKHTFSVTDTSDSMLVGCLPAGVTGTSSACANTPVAAPAAWACPARFNTGRFQPVPPESTCAEVLNTANTTAWFGTNPKYDAGTGDPGFPSHAECPRP